MDEQIELEESLQSFIYKEIDPLKFERLVINQPSIEDLVGASLYTEMIACNFRSYEDVQQLRQRVLSWALDYYQVSKEGSDVLISLAIVFPCRKFLAYEKGLIETCRHLNSVYSKYFNRWKSSEDFKIFVAVSCETDHLPVGSEAKKFWNQDALKAKEHEIKELEAHWYPDVTGACKNLISIYGD